MKWRLVLFKYRLQTPLFEGARKFQSEDKKLGGGDTIDHNSTKSSLNLPQTSKGEEKEDEDGEAVDFDKLKKLRQMLMKQRVVKYMDLLKQRGTEEEEDKIVDDTVSPTTKEN